MEKEAIKIWKVKVYASPLKVELYHDKIAVSSPPLSPSQKPYYREYSIASRLTAKDVFCNEELDAELTDLIIQHCNFDDSFSDKEKQHWHFWKHLNRSKIPVKKYKTQTKVNNYPSFLETTPLSIKSGYRIGNKTYDHIPVRLNQLFFYGPSLPTIALKDRKEIQQMFLNALGENCPLTKKDAFLLFDYNNIPQKKWEYTASSYQYDFIELKGDRFWIGGRDGRDGGATIQSIEYVWYNPSPYNFFKKANKEIKTILTKAIIVE